MCILVQGSRFPLRGVVESKFRSAAVPLLLFCAAGAFKVQKNGGWESSTVLRMARPRTEHTHTQKHRS